MERVTIADELEQLCRQIFRVAPYEPAVLALTQIIADAPDVGHQKRQAARERLRSDQR
jgi:hypothetical protein